MIFVTSDTHYDHINIIKHCNRNFADVNEMNERLIEAWNSVVRPDDIVWHLGDIAWGGQKSYEEFLNNINGTIVLFLGNHDRLRYLHSRKIHAIYQYNVRHTMQEHGRTFQIAHVPDTLKPWLDYGDDQQRLAKPIVRLCGHVHNSLPVWIDLKQDWDQQKRKHIGPAQPWLALNMCVEHWNYTPVPLDEVITVYDYYFRKASCSGEL